MRKVLEFTRANLEALESQNAGAIDMDLLVGPPPDFSQILTPRDAFSSGKNSQVSHPILES